MQSGKGIAERTPNMIRHQSPVTDIAFQLAAAVCQTATQPITGWLTRLFVDRSSNRHSATVIARITIC